MDCIGGLWWIALVGFGGLHSSPDVVTRPIGVSVLPLAAKRSPESPNQRCLIPPLYEVCTSLHNLYKSSDES